MAYGSAIPVQRHAAVPSAQAVATNSVFILEWTRPVALEEYFLPAAGVISVSRDAV